MKTWKSTIILAAILTTPLACDPVGQAPPTQGGAAGSTAPATTAEEEHEESGHRELAAGDDNAPLTAPASVGAPVSEEVALVDAAEVIANPERFEGQTVRLRGQVKGYCHHRRAWFALDVPTASPPYLRVLTAPAFQVPGGIMNATAVTVGVVELEEVPRSRAGHYEQEHALGTAADDGIGPVRRAVLRATGATFTPAS